MVLELTRKIALALSLFNPACAPLCCKNLCCASRFCTGGGGAGDSRSKNLLEGAMKASARTGHNLSVLNEAWKVGHQQHPGPENQDSQHMLNQPRKFSPD